MSGYNPNSEPDRLRAEETDVYWSEWEIATGDEKPEFCDWDESVRYMGMSKTALIKEIRSQKIIVRKIREKTKEELVGTLWNGKEWRRRRDRDIDWVGRGV